MVILPKDPLEQGYRLLSGSEDASIRIWDLDSGDCQSVLEQDAGISCLLVSPRLGFEDKLVFFGDQVNFFLLMIQWQILAKSFIMHLIENYYKFTSSINILVCDPFHWWTWEFLKLLFYWWLLIWDYILSQRKHELNSEWHFYRKANWVILIWRAMMLSTCCPTSSSAPASTAGPASITTKQSTPLTSQTTGKNINFVQKPK